MKFFLRLFWVALLAGCSSVAVHRDYDTSIDFSTYKTFAWQHDVQPETGNQQLDNDLNDFRIRTAINTTLINKGLLLVECDKADCLIAYFVDRERRLNSGAVSVGVMRGAGRYGGGVGYSSGVSEYDQANLTIDVLNASDERMVWRGTGARVVYEGSNPEKYSQLITTAVDKILKKFPPH